MSRIDDLIAEHCPEGVEFLPLSEVCDDFIVPMRDRPKIFNGDIPWCRIEDIQGTSLNGSLSGLGVTEDIVREMNLKIVPTGTVIAACSASLGNYAIASRPLITNQTFIGLVCGERLYNRYLLHLMFTKTDALKAASTTGTIAYVSRKKFENLVIPVPPIEVQRAIVEVLDTFSALEAELEAELEARKQQYEHYRTELVKCDDAPVFSVSEIVKGISSGRNKSRVDGGRFPVYGSTGQIGTTDETAYSGDSLLVARVGANAGRVNAVSGEYDVSDNTLIITPTETWDMRFAFHQLTQMNLNQYAVGGGQPLVTGKLLKNLKVHVPALTEQRRIAAILDKFDALVNDLSFGLPAELSARRQQYEYYRDKLLTFKEFEVAA